MFFFYPFSLCLHSAGGGIVKYEKSKRERKKEREREKKKDK